MTGPSAMRAIRLRLGAWILGGDLLSVWSLLWLIRERAMRAVTRDGLVTLSECEPLAEVLYEQVPGNWDFSISRRDG